ncbi:hypothetical protein HK101_006596 [Irineochytrium annulatum]|nr:hypothetical protein HK101_006596 [Irineochytrium annulatum]
MAPAPVSPSRESAKTFSDSWEHDEDRWNWPASPEPAPSSATSIVTTAPPPLSAPAQPPSNGYYTWASSHAWHLASTLTTTARAYSLPVLKSIGSVVPIASCLPIRVAKESLGVDDDDEEVMDVKRLRSIAEEDDDECDDVMRKGRVRGGMDASGNALTPPPSPPGMMSMSMAALPRMMMGKRETESERRAREEEERKEVVERTVYREPVVAKGGVGLGDALTRRKRD